ncbi:MAG: hypothetical protein A3D44_02325 [Candidatus Staskawiczbacteria bacterium RIFCSPHIGHO2_02_FULL_42_22]|uniref:HD domain-containing protein n=1 Tax=Candidatus Staskawiczbacteria bacterium RIFCSPHIGHO2_02_FULL_42_22 TaxID=1802207 RepID=A0A1G2I2B5_9BACT|nr:MAG: hypothetical protein A3D44_02325 [Candidatus Staskawiczbacteria bacterium RIFCSPHIGHO2_02_FULL_42_22]
MLDYVLRIRDLIHGTILFTEKEMLLINHPFFQRLRQIKQNDVAFYVYPSMHISRFEHVLGVCRIAGMMAETLTKSPKWDDYKRALKTETGLSRSDEGIKRDFVQLCRFYALLHDIGHFPLSHLFEHAMEQWLGPDYSQKIVEWTGFEGFEKPHEAFGATLTRRLIRDIKIPKDMGDCLLRLMGEKDLPQSNPLHIAKSVIDAEIDADRIDFVQRDGLAAGGEYGNYDVRRLCDSVFIEQLGDNWLIAFSEKAITSMEALLHDRYRTYTWVQFHHKTVEMKALVRFLIQNLLEVGLVTKEHFNFENAKEFSLKDDVWLWSMMRGMKSDDKFVKMVQGAVFYREKKYVLNLWKTRPDYHRLQDWVAAATLNPSAKVEATDQYAIHLNKEMKKANVMALVFDFGFFKPVESDPRKPEKHTRLYSEPKKRLTGETLLQASKLVAHLPVIRSHEPQYFVILVGHNARMRSKRLEQRWIDSTSYWIDNPPSPTLFP